MAFNQFPSKGGIPSGNTAARPSGPVIGDTYYNGQLEILEIYNGTAWVAISAPPAVPTVTSVTDFGTGLAYTSGATLTVVLTPGTGGATALQYNAVTDTGNFSATSSSTTLSLTGLTPATSFAVSANAQNNFGTTVNSAPFNAVLATTKPQAPTIGTATASTSANEATATWTLGATGGKNLSAITITPYLNGTTAETSRTAATTSSTSYTFTDGQLTPGASYTFKVKTTNANGDSPESSATNSITVANLLIIDYLVVAGGGGGGGGGATWAMGSGGGAGGLLSTVTATGGGGALETSLGVALATNYTVTIGGGGAGGPGYGTSAVAGTNSVFSTVTATGGGKGGSLTINTSLGGGSGGGGAQSGSLAGGARTASPVQGFNGGDGTAYTNNSNSGGGGGGGGAGAVGGAGVAGTGGAGGNGAAVSITGSSVTYAGGGGGGASTGAAGGTGGGGAGGSAAAPGPGTAGTANRGGGGGGGAHNASSPNDSPGGAGGSGVVILRYSDARTITIGAGLTGTESAASGGYKRATLTSGSGNVSWA